MTSQSERAHFDEDTSVVGRRSTPSASRFSSHTFVRGFSMYIATVNFVTVGVGSKLDIYCLNIHQNPHQQRGRGGGWLKRRKMGVARPGRKTGGRVSSLFPFLI